MPYQKEIYLFDDIITKEGIGEVGVTKQTIGTLVSNYDFITPQS